jgi:hypothetical protein
MATHSPKTAPNLTLYVGFMLVAEGAAMRLNYNRRPTSLLQIQRHDRPPVAHVELRSDQRG